jgi:hypothetical protein
MDALFTAISDSTWEPGELARGPWDPRHCHGGPVAALLARAVEHVDDGEWHVARLTTELLRPVPVGEPLELRAEIERPGRKVSLVGAHLTQGETAVARARALRIRTEDGPLPDGTVHVPDEPPGAPSDAGAHAPVWRRSFGTDDRAYHSHACEHLVTSGDYAVPGPVGVWIRLVADVVDGEAPSGLQRVVAAADFGNGVSAGFADDDDYTFINPDLTIHLARPFVGEWVGLWASTLYGGDRFVGTGFAETSLYDAGGRVGRGVQSLLVARQS